MKITKQLSPDPIEVGGAANQETVVETNVVEQTPQEKNFGAIVDAFKENAETTTKEEKPIETGQVENTEPVIKPEEKKEEVKATETKPEEKKEEVKVEEPVFKIPGQENLPPTTWEALKSKLNLDVKEEKPELYEEAINKLIDTKREETRSLTLDKLIEKEPIEIQEAYLFAKHGDAKAIDNHLGTLSQLKRMDSLSLIEQDLRLANRDWTDEQVEAKLTELTENNQVDATAAPLRKLVEESYNATVAERTAFVQSLREKQQNSAIQEKENLANGTSEYFKTFKDFMGVAVDDKTRSGMQQYIVSGIKEGKYSNVLSPAELAEWRLYKEFGSQAISNIKTTEFAKGRDTKTKDLHNVPPKQQGMTTQAMNKVRDSNNPFAALQSEFGIIS